MAANNFVYTAHRNVYSLGARSVHASVSDVQVAQGAVALHKEPVATIAHVWNGDAAFQVGSKNGGDRYALRVFCTSSHSKHQRKASVPIPLQ